MTKHYKFSHLAQLYILLSVPMAFFLVFSYVPMVGVLISFQNYNIFKGFFGSKWVGFDVFREIFAMKGFWVALWNTLMLNGLNLLIGFPSPIILALL